MMVLDHVGDQEAMVYAQLGQQPLVRTTATSLEPRRGTLSCLSARPPDLATATAAQPEVACVRPSIVPFLYSKRTAAARSPGSRYRQSIVLSPFRAHTSRGTKGYGLKCPGWWECSLAAISQTTTHMHGHHEATMGLAGVSLGRELRALALSHTASVRRGTA